METNALGQRIAAARRARGMTQEDLAEALTVGPMTVSKWERGINVPELRRLADLSAALGVPSGWLVDGDPDDVPPEPADFVPTRSSKRKAASALGRYAEVALDHLDAAERHLAKLRDGIERGAWYVGAVDLGLAIGRLGMIPAQLQGAAEHPAIESSIALVVPEKSEGAT